MGHNHSHGPTNYGRAFALGISLNVGFVAVEAAFGFWTGSLALLSDAGHNLGDVLGLLMAWGGHALSQIRPSRRRTYGWQGSTILAALANALLLLAAVGGIVWEALRRFSEPAPLAGMTIVTVAAVGVVINTWTALLFLKGRKDDLNIRGAYLHMASDAAVSFGVVLAGLAIQLTGLNWIDPATSLVIAVVIFVSTWQLLLESINLALQAVPAGIEPAEVYEYLGGLEGVVEVHDLHIWAMSTAEAALTVHLVKPEIANDDSLLAEIQRELHDRFQIEHVTIQIERSVDGTNCAQACVDEK